MESLFLYVRPAFFRRLDRAASLTGRLNSSIKPFMVMSGCCSIFKSIFSMVAGVIFGFLPLFLGLGVMFPVVRCCCHTRLTVCLWIISHFAISCPDLPACLCFTIVSLTRTGMGSINFTSPNTIHHKL